MNNYSLITNDTFDVKAINLNIPTTNEAVFCKTDEEIQNWATSPKKTSPSSRR